ncbi:MAG: helix-turn-helix domain-containing protein [Actinomycetota bacterium]
MPEAPGTPGGDRRSVKRISDPRALRALAHPIRLALVGLLRTEGPLTATRAAALLGESSGSCSFHLRQLAKYGLVEEAGGGHGREKPWRATAMFTQWSDGTGEPAEAEAAAMLSSIVAERYFDDVRRWLQARREEPVEWRDAAPFGDTFLYVTAPELAELTQQTRALTDRFLDRLTQPELRPPGARLVTYLHLAFPMMSLVGHPLPASLAAGTPSAGTSAAGASSAGAPATVGPTTGAAGTRPGESA